MTYTEIQQTLDQFSAEIGKVVVGYIGNTYGMPGTPAYVDDTICHVWFEDFSRKLDPTYGNRPSLILGSKAELRELTAEQLCFRVGKRVQSLLSLQHKISNELRKKGWTREQIADHLR